MNAQKRRMRELQHKRDIEKLLHEKLAVNRACQELEWEERRIVAEQEQLKVKLLLRKKRDSLGNIRTSFTSLTQRLLVLMECNFNY